MSALVIPDALWLRDTRRDRLLRSVRAFPRWFLVLVLVELPLVGITLEYDYVWEWWRDGVRHTGIVVDVDDPDGGPLRVTIRDPETELERVVGPDLWHPDVGDTGTAVIHPSDPSKVATPAQVVFYVGLWTIPLLASLGWPILHCWGSINRRAGRAGAPTTRRSRLARRGDPRCP